MREYRNARELEIFPAVYIPVQNAARQFGDKRKRFLPLKACVLQRRIDLFDNTNPVLRIKKQ
jgi:hypothetical protein